MIWVVAPGGFVSTVGISSRHDVDDPFCTFLSERGRGWVAARPDQSAAVRSLHARSAGRSGDGAGSTHRRGAGDQGRIGLWPPDLPGGPERAPPTSR